MPFKKPSGSDLDDNQHAFNTTFNPIRAAVERAIAHVKTWRTLSQEGGHYRPPIEKFEETQHTIISLYPFAAFA